MRSRTAAVDRALDGYLKCYPEQSGTIWRAMHYGLFPGGKRIRPILVLAAGEIFAGKAQGAFTVCLRRRNDSWLFAHS